MASRKSLKQNVNYIAGELFGECLLNSMSEKADKNEADKILTRILEMQDEFVSRISHTEPGNVKGFYRKFRSDFNKEVDEIVDAITKLG